MCAALSLINSVARIAHLRQMPGHAAHTAELAHRVLTWPTGDG